MADSASERGADSDGDPDEPGFDPSADMTKMTDKDQKKIKKNIEKWRIFSDFLFRHIAIATFKYNCFEHEELTQFLIALEKAEALRETSKLKKGDEPRITSLKVMRDSAELLVQNHFTDEAGRIRHYLDVAGRMKGIAMIAGGYYKALKKGKVRNIDKIKYYLDFWKGFCVRSFDYTALSFRNCDPETFNPLEKRYRAWPTVVRTSLNLSQKFLKKTSEATGIPLISQDPKVLQKHMQAAEFIVATRIEDMLFQRVVSETKSFLLGTPLVTSANADKQKQKWELPAVEDIDPVMLSPIPDNGTLLALPEDPPKEKKGKKKGKGKKGKRGASAGSSKGKKKKRK